MSLSDMRAELRELRKEHVKPVSRMRKADISAEIEKLRRGREETPAPAAVPSAKSKMQKAAVESLKEAKMKEFPVAPDSGTKKGMPRKTARKAYEDVPKHPKAPKAPVKMSKADMRKMVEEMTSDEE